LGSEQIQFTPERELLQKKEKTANAATPWARDSLFLLFFVLFFPLP
jgi:hypothetical protein